METPHHNNNNDDNDNNKKESRHVNSSPYGVWKNRVHQYPAWKPPA